MPSNSLRRFASKADPRCSNGSMIILRHRLLQMRHQHPVLALREIFYTPSSHKGPRKSSSSSPASSRSFRLTIVQQIGILQAARLMQYGSIARVQNAIQRQPPAQRRYPTFRSILTHIERRDRHRISSSQWLRKADRLGGGDGCACQSAGKFSRDQDIKSRSLMRKRRLIAFEYSPVCTRLSLGRQQ